MSRFKRFLIHYYGAITVILVLVIGYGFLIGLVPDGSMMIAAIGGLLSFAYFVQKQKLEESQLFRELFDSFNKRYDGMNEDLAEINRSNSPELTTSQSARLIDYFNLCAEEYLYFRQGYIFLEVWEAWYNGMNYYYKNPRIAELWDEELKTNAYYGFSLK